MDHSFDVGTDSVPLGEQFVGRVAHDLRSELTTLLAGVHLMLRRGVDHPESADTFPLGPMSRDTLERAAAAGARLAVLLDEFAEAPWMMKRVQDGVRTTRTESCSVDAVVALAIERLRQRTRSRSIECIVHGADGASAVVGDSELLGTAFEHMLDFATARAPEVPVIVEVQQRLETDAAEAPDSPARSNGRPEDGHVMVSIRDSGPAVAAARLEALFEPFVEQQAIPPPAPGAPRRERLGLGLSIARGILEAHGGTVCAVASQPEGGVTLRCLLPKAPVADASRPR